MVIGTAWEFTVDTLLIRLSVELHFRKGLFIKWTAFDALAGEDSVSFYRGDPQIRKAA